MEPNENFNAFFFPIKVLQARHGEMNCFLGETCGKGLPSYRKCFQFLGLLLHTHATVLTPCHMAAFTVLVLKAASSWIWAEKTPGWCWSCFDRELVLRFSLLKSWMLKSPSTRFWYRVKGYLFSMNNGNFVEQNTGNYNRALASICPKQVYFSIRNSKNEECVKIQKCYEDKVFLYCKKI